jgi:hypothetical protein
MLGQIERGRGQPDYFNMYGKSRNGFKVSFTELMKPGAGGLRNHRFQKAPAAAGGRREIRNFHHIPL